MSKHRKKYNNESNDGVNNFDFSNFNMSQMGNLFNNINPNQLSALLNNLDMNQLYSMFQGLTGGGAAGSPAPAGTDRRVELLNAIKPLVDADKSRLIDSILQIYTITRMIKK